MLGWQLRIKRWRRLRYRQKVLKKMKKTAEDYLGEKIKDAVITVPALFQRLAAAGYQRRWPHCWGLMCYASSTNLPRPRLPMVWIRDHNDVKIAVYDLGGGTFDVSIIEMAKVDGEQQFQVLATHGDTFLGGEDFDNLVIDFLVEEF